MRFIGFGSPIYVYTDTTSIYFPDNINSQYMNVPWAVHLTVEETGGCKDSLYQAVVVRNQSFTYVGLKNENKTNSLIATYPNPVNGILTIETKGIDQNEIRSISMVNSLSEEVRSFKRFKGEIDLSDLPSGIYFIKIETLLGDIWRKIVKE